MMIVLLRPEKREPISWVDKDVAVATCNLQVIVSQLRVAQPATSTRLGFLLVSQYPYQFAPMKKYQIDTRFDATWALLHTVA